MQQAVVLAILDQCVGTSLDQHLGSCDVAGGHGITQRSDLLLVPSVDIEHRALVAIFEHVLEGVVVAPRGGLVQVLRRRHRRLHHVPEGRIWELAGFLVLGVARNLVTETVLHQCSLRHGKAGVHGVVDRHSLRQLQGQTANEVDGDERENLHNQRGSPAIVLRLWLGGLCLQLLYDRGADENRREDQVAEEVVPAHLGRAILPLQHPVDLELEVRIWLRQRGDPQPALVVVLEPLGREPAPNAIKTPEDRQLQEDRQTATKRVHVHSLIEIRHHHVHGLGVVLVLLLDLLNLGCQQLHHGGALQLALVQRVEEQLDEDRVRNDAPTKGLLHAQGAQLSVTILDKTSLETDEAVPPVVLDGLTIHRVPQDQAVQAIQVRLGGVQRDLGDSGHCFHHSRGLRGVRRGPEVQGGHA
mmetsp:Transcript_12143/g.32562  ORF Transcript_12143/g.32562 Transcript_12143/m.32562 type:complete len:414 (+) Transcript_12143:1036-2277(+)